MIAHNAVASTDGLIKTGPGNLVSVILVAGTGAAATLIIYDALTATGTKLLPTIRALQGDTVVVDLPAKVPFSTGCYADVGGDGAEYSVQVE